MTAQENYVRHLSNGNGNNLIGVSSTIQIQNAASASIVYGNSVSIQLGGTGNVTNAYGVYIYTSRSSTGQAINQYGLYIDSHNLASTLNYAIYTNLGINRFGDQISIFGAVDRQQLTVTGHTTQAVGTPLVQFTRNDTAAGISSMLSLTCLGSGANGDGGSILLAGKTSTTAAQPMGLDQWLFVNATHASYTVRRVFNVYDAGGIREGLRIEASGTAPMLGFYGGAAVVRGAALTAQLTTITHTAPGTPDYALQDLIDSSAGACFGFATKDEGNSALAVIVNLQTRVAELEARLGSSTGVNLFA
jgi:hypothetical protein